MTLTQSLSREQNLAEGVESSQVTHLTERIGAYYEESTNDRADSFETRDRESKERLLEASSFSVRVRLSETFLSQGFFYFLPDDGLGDTLKSLRVSNAFHRFFSSSRNYSRACHTAMQDSQLNSRVIR